MPDQPTLVCTVCHRPVARSWFDRGPRRRWVHLDPSTERPAPADHTPVPGPPTTTTTPTT